MSILNCSIIQHYGQSGWLSRTYCGRRGAASAKHTSNTPCDATQITAEARQPREDGAGIEIGYVWAMLVGGRRVGQGDRICLGSAGLGRVGKGRGVWIKREMQYE